MRVLVVEDSRTQRELLIHLLQMAGKFVIVGTASTGKEAVDATIRLRPDVVAMDIHLPVFDGYEATRQIMQRCPTPIVMISNSIGDAARRSLEAQTVGALAVIRKPGGRNDHQHEQDKETFIKTLWLMADVPVVTRHRPRKPHPSPVPALRALPNPAVLAIAASTGGPAAVQVLLKNLGADFPLPILLAQHIAQGFVEALVDWFNHTTPLTVRIVQSGEPLQPGHVYVPPDNQHLVVYEQGSVALHPSKPGDRYCPSGDYLFRSVAQVYGALGMGLIMTGMGNDGAAGLHALHAAGGLTFAQDEASCVVYGMPQAAVLLGAVVCVEPLTNLAHAIWQRVGQPGGKD